jgi:hypothetical protein
MKTNLILQRSLFFSISHLTTNFNQLSNRSISLVRKSAFLVCIGLLGFNSWEQSIFTNPITGTNPNTSNPYTSGQTVASGITVSGIGRGSGISGVDANNRYNANGWGSSFNNNDYFEWVITPGCMEIDFISFVYTSERSHSSVSNFSFRSSLDNFSSNIGSPDFDGTTISLSASTFQNITSPITFRFYTWGSNATRTFSINDFTFNGIVTASAISNPTATASQTFCQGSTVANLSATGTALKWYSTSFGGSALSASTTLSSGSYFVSQTIGGCESNQTLTAGVTTFGSGNTATTNRGLVFNLTNDIVLQSFKVNSSGAGTITVTLTNTGSNTSFSKTTTVSLVSGSNTINVETWGVIPVGTGYRLLLSSNTNGLDLSRTESFTFPLTFPFGSITGNVDNNGSDRYNFFYDWKIVTPRPQVAVTVTPNNTVVAASSTPTLCINSALTNITHSTTGATGIGTAIGLPAGVTASWASNTITISGTPTASGTFNYTIPLTGGCSSVNATGTITVNQPATSITIDGTTIGNGDYLWNGNINSNGNVSGNWYVLNNGIYSVPNQAPQENHEVFVVSPSQAVSCVSSDLTIPNAGNFRSDNIHIGQDANLTLGNNASLNVRGNFVNNGNVNTGNGLVNFTGNSAVQIIRGTGALNFSNVKIDKSAGKVSLNNDISISGTLEFQQGNLDLNGKTLNYSGGYGITTTNGGLIGDAVQSKLNLTTSSQITDGLFHNGEIYDLTIATNASVSSSGSYIISNSLIVGNGATFTKEDGYTIIFKGDVVNNGSIIDGTSGIFGGSIVFNNTVNQTISGQPVSIANLEVVKASGKLIVSTPITVTGKLEMNGNIDNPSSLITLGNSSEPGSLVYTSGTITGALRRYFPATPGSSTYFPVGNASNTRGATIAFTSSPGANQYLTVKYQGGAAGGTAPLYTGLPLTTGDGVLIQNFDEEGYWEINPTANDYAQSINTTPYTITLQMKNLSNVNDRSTVRVIKAAGSNNPSQHHGAWTALTFDANAVSGNSNSDFTVTGTSTGFSWFGAGSGNNNPLPVELVSFSGLCEEGVVNLTWQTASEFNSSHFDVEKSRDGENWQLLSTVPSAGTSNELITYQSFDKNGTNGNNYYRLRQVDIDGTEKVYDPINVSCTEETPGYFSSFPNPSGTSFQVVVNNKELIGVCTLNMVDATGKVIEQREIEVKDGINMFVINQELTPGIYFMNITNGSKSTSMLRHAIK